MKALITGISGQDGSFLADLLVEKGYDVHGIVRRQATPSYQNLRQLIDQNAIRLHEADLADLRSLEAVVELVKPDEIYHLAAMTHVGSSFAMPEYTANITGAGALRVFEAARKHAKRARIYNASSSEMFGRTISELGLKAADESTPLCPVSPYAVAKVDAHNFARTYRKSYGMYISSGILFNHESERRGELFVTRKITKAIARIKLGLQDKLVLGNLQAVRDWGYAPDYVAACWRMLQQDQPDDFVIATGEGHTVTEFAFAAQDASGMENELEIESVPQEKRPTDIDYLVGDASKAARVLGWRPKTDFKSLVKIMVDHDLKLAKEEKARANPS